MPVHTYLLAPSALTLTDLTGPSLDAVSLQLPAGAYTTLRTYEGNRILGLSAHLQRLVDSLRTLNRPRPIDPLKIRAALRQVLEREALASARLRITTPFDSEAIYLSIEPYAGFPPAFYHQGVRCATIPFERTMPAAKQTAFIAPARSAKAELSPEIHELLMVNSAGQILEGLSSNFYAVIAGTLCTAGEGVLEGVTRQIVLAEARQLGPVALTAIRVSDLPRVTEAFLTSSGREVMPVRRVDEVDIGEPGPLSQELLTRYRRQIVQAAEWP